MNDDDAADRTQQPPEGQPDEIPLRAVIVRRRSDGVLLTLSRQGARLTLDDAREILEAYLTLSGGRKAPLLIDMRGLNAVTKEARTHLTGPEGAKTATAVALLVSSMLTRVIANFFIGLNKPQWPVRLFSSEEEALRWLAQHPPEPARQRPPTHGER